MSAPRHRREERHLAHALKPCVHAAQLFVERYPHGRHICEGSSIARLARLEFRDEFRNLFALMCPKLGFEYDEAAVDYVVEKHYKAVNRKFRCCQPRDLLLQIRNYCLYNNLPIKMTADTMDFAVSNYFAVMR